MDLVGIEDGELARRVMSSPPGEARSAEGELFRRFAPRVRLYGLRHLKNEAAAEDLVQRVLIVTIEKLRLGQVREPERIASFVLGTARLVSREIARGTHRELAIDSEPTLVESRPSEPGDPLARRHLARCLEALSEKARTVLLMTFFQDENARTIGSALGIDEGHVRVIRHRAIDRVRDCMGVSGAASA